MSAHMKGHLTSKATCKVVIEMPGKAKKLTFVPAKYVEKLEAFLEKYGESDSIPWEELAKDRIAKYGKVGTDILRSLKISRWVSAIHILQA